MLDSEKELIYRSEELESQNEELAAAVEELLRKNSLLNSALDQIKERNDELSQLVYRTSHDLKSPLTSVKGLLYLMQQEELSPILLNYLQMLDKVMSQMNGVLYSVSLFNRAAIDEVNCVFFPAFDLVKKVVNSFCEFDGYETIQFHIDVNPDLIIKTDLSLVEAALKALVENSIFYRNVVKPEVTIAVSLTKTEINIVIQDNGDGMDEDVLRKAFNMFYRGNGRSKGTGLGLYIVRKIMQRIEGNIKLFPQPTGLRVELELPIL